MTRAGDGVDVGVSEGLSALTLAFTVSQAPRNKDRITIVQIVASWMCGWARKFGAVVWFGDCM